MKLDYFLGKPCTILTQKINRDFVQRGETDEMKFSDFFSGFVDHIDEDQIWMTHPVTECKSVFFTQYVVGIVEEQMKYENDPKIQEALKNFKDGKLPKKEQPKNTSFVSVNDISNLAKESRKKWEMAASEVK